MRIIALRNTRASGEDRLPLHHTESIHKHPNVCHSALNSRLRLIQFQAEPYNGTEKTKRTSSSTRQESNAVTLSPSESCDSNMSKCCPSDPLYLGFHLTLAPTCATCTLCMGPKAHTSVGSACIMRSIATLFLQIASFDQPRKTIPNCLSLVHFVPFATLGKYQCSQPTIFIIHHHFKSTEKQFKQVLND
jgi:hypothetical protein